MPNSLMNKSLFSNGNKNHIKSSASLFHSQSKTNITPGILGVKTANNISNADYLQTASVSITDTQSNNETVENLPPINQRKSILKNSKNMYSNFKTQQPFDQRGMPVKAMKLKLDFQQSLKQLHDMTQSKDSQNADIEVEESNSPVGHLSPFKLNNRASILSQNQQQLSIGNLIEQKEKKKSNQRGFSNKKRSLTLKNISIDNKGTSKISTNIMVSPLSKKLTSKKANANNDSQDSEGSSMIEDGDFYDQKSRKTTASKSITLKMKKSVSAVDQMAAIFSKPLEEREKNDKDKIVQFLRNGVPFLVDVQLPLLALLSDKLEPITCKSGEVLMRKGDEADCMYIIYQGEVGIFADVECTIQFASCKPNQVFGEKALENNNKRGASIKCLTECKLLRLKKLFFKSIVLDVIMMQKFQALEFLKTIDILKNWSLIKLQNFNKYLTEKNYAPGNIVYKQGDESSVFYIIRKGSVLVETIIDIDEYNRYPVDIKTWEIVKKTKRIRYKIQELGKAQIFGHNEMILEVPRQTTIKALEETNILYLNKEIFMEVIEPSDIKIIKSQVQPIDVEKIAIAVLSIKNNSRLRTEAILNATQMNLPVATNRDFGMLNRQKSQMFRLKAWHEKIRIVNMRNNSLTKTQEKKNRPEDLLDDSDDDDLGQLNEELKKVKILKITPQKIRVSGNEYIKQQDILSTELKHRVRLATNILETEF
eukprot:403351043